MAADVVPYFRPQFFDANGLPLDGGKVYTYKAGTTTPLVTYQDAAFTQNTNPIILDSAGTADIFIGVQPVKFVIYDQNDVLIKTVDNVTGASGTAVGVQTIVPITTDGVETTFALGVDPEVPQNCTVVVQPTVGDRVVYMTSEYTVDGQNLTFNSAPPAGTGEIRVGSTRAIASSGLSDGVVSTIKLQDLCVTNAKLSNDSVGTSKIQDGAVTKAKFDGGEIPNSWRAALGQQISASSGAFTSTATFATFVDVTNLSVTITTSGRPVFIGLQATDSMSWIGMSVASFDAVQGRIRLLRGSTVLTEERIQSDHNGATSCTLRIPPSMRFIDTPAAGTYTYKVSVERTTGTFEVNNVKLLAFEL